ncbi:MAG: methyltransferase family protein [Nitrospiraceae bacterium]
MQVLELKVPPVAVVLCVAALMWLASWAFPTFEFTVPARQILSLSVAVVGVVISGSGVVSFRRARTTVNPLKPESASTLVRSGIYLLTRNPMYLGLLVILLGWAIFLANALAFVLLPAFILYMNRFQIEPEERALASLFGQAFVSYKSCVRRWL